MFYTEETKKEKRIILKMLNLLYLDICIVKNHHFENFLLSFNEESKQRGAWSFFSDTP